MRRFFVFDEGSPAALADHGEKAHAAQQCLDVWGGKAGHSHFFYFRRWSCADSIEMNGIESGYLF